MNKAGAKIEEGMTGGGMTTDTGTSRGTTEEGGVEVATAVTTVTTGTITTKVETFARTMDLSF